MHKQIKYKKRIRLKSFDYCGQYRYFVTICVNKNVGYDGNVGQGFSLANKDIINKIVEILKSVAEEHSFNIWAYCFMPDHLHLLVEGAKTNSNLKKFVSMFKQKTGFYFRQKFCNSLWQVNYYEKILRKEDDTFTVARYIFNNPVRKGLTKDFRNWLFSDSLMFDFKEMQP